MGQENPDIAAWEQLEIKRSAAEASHTNSSALRADKRQVARYLNPPADTCYPLEYAYHLLGDARGKTVLDFGCGSGENTLLLAERGAKVIAFDISTALIGLAQQRLKVNDIKGDVKFIASSAHDLSLADDSVDIVFGIAILRHLQLPLVAGEVRRVLRKGGRAIFQEPLRNSKVVAKVRKMIPYQAPDVSPFERPLTDKELEEFACGFSEYKSRAFSLPYISLARILPAARNLVHPLYRFDGRVLKKLPSLEHYATRKVIEMVK